MMRKVGKSIFYEKEEPDTVSSAEKLCDAPTVPVGEIARNLVKEFQNMSHMRCKTGGEDDTLSEVEKARNDIVISEAEYLGNLRVLTEAYIKPVTPILSPEELRQLFGNIESVIESSERLLGELCNVLTTNDMYDVLVTAATSYLTVYIQYCANLPTALNLLPKLLSERDYFREKVCDGECDERGIGLQSYLLKPFQRLTRLPLLLAPLEKAGEPAAPAIRAITKLVEECNNSVREPMNPPSEGEDSANCRRSSSFYVEL